ncbi:MAG TPA: VOC family protein [Chitinophagales bacterium]|nr:VOC family protein [Chitinophagales bacterium]
MTTVNVYLNFNGNCEEAFLYYKSIFNTDKFQTFVKFSDMPPHEGAPPIPDEMKSNVMHVALRISEETVLMGSDTGGEWAPYFKQGNNFSISISTDSKEQANHFFNKLSEGGTIKMPIMDTFWGEYFGMAEDKFGINWMVSHKLGEK